MPSGAICRKLKKLQNYLGMAREHAWETLPVDLQIRILSNISVTDLFRMRLVCKDWYKTTRTLFFQMPRFFLSGMPQGRQHVVTCRRFPDLWFTTYPFDADIGVEGLLLSWDSTGQHSRVLDVRTCKRHKLTPHDVVHNMPRPGLVVDTSATPYNFKLVGGHTHTQIYDSRSRSWIARDSRRGGTGLRPATSSAHCNGLGFTGAWDDNNHFNHFDADNNLLVYNLGSDQWDRVSPPPGVLRDIGSWQNQLYIVTVHDSQCKVHKHSNHSPDDPWTTVSHMPDDLRSHLEIDLDPYEHFGELSKAPYRHRHYYAAFSQKYILLYLLDHYYDEIDRFAIFNLKNDSWTQVNIFGVQYGRQTTDSDEDSEEDDSSGEE